MSGTIPSLSPTQRINLTIHIPLPIEDLSPTDIRTERVVSPTLSQLKDSAPAVRTRLTNVTIELEFFSDDPTEATFPEARTERVVLPMLTQLGRKDRLSPTVSSKSLPEEFLKEDITEEERLLIENSSGEAVDGLFTKKEFTDTVNRLWNSNVEGSIAVCFKADSAKYYFKFETKSAEIETLDFQILKICKEGAQMPFDTAHIRFNTIEDAIESLAPLFDQKERSDIAFDKQIQSRLRQIPKDLFLADTDNIVFDDFPTQESFAQDVNWLWETRDTWDRCIALSFQKKSNAYIFKFQETEWGTVYFDCLADINGVIGYEPQPDHREFSDIEGAIEALKPFFSDKEGSDTAFFEQLEKIFLSGRKQPVEISSPTEDNVCWISIEDLRNFIPSILENEKRLVKLDDLVRADPSTKLKDAFGILEEMSDTMILEIGGEPELMPLSGLVFYYLHMIQLNETPHVPNNDSDYAIKAFQNSEEGYTSTGDQRVRALLYTRAHILFFALATALENVYYYQPFIEEAQKCISHIRALGEKMPETQLKDFQLDLTKEPMDNLHSLDQARKAMKEALKLP